MDILDIIIAKNKSFTNETAKLTKQAQEAMAKANEVATKLDEAQEALDAAEAANTRAQEVVDTFDSLQANVNETVNDIVDDKIETAITSINSSVNTANTNATAAQAAAAEAVTEVDVIDANTSAAKIKKTRVRKKGVQQAYETMKNYTSTGTNEDGSMTQKAITQALQNQKTELETRINNIPSSGGSGSAPVLSPENEGSMISVGENGTITPSSITETDVIITQIAAGTYQNNDIIGLEIDYVNKTFKRLQGASNKTAGQDFDKFVMLGGRKRCIVNENGTIEKFLTSEDTIESILNKRIMVYQPQVYYLRVPLSTTTTENGIKINKEQIYISDKKYAGFNIHPIFKDKNDNIVKYVLLPAYESGTLRANGLFEREDAQDINFNTDKLVSIVNTKPISGDVQEFTYEAAEQMAHNNGAGWELTDLRFESLNQMLMIIEYGSLNMQSAFNMGLTQVSNTNSGNISSYSGSTHALLNSSGQALSTLNGNGNTYTNAGRCAISYRGLENPYGNIWRFIGNMSIINRTIMIGEDELSFKLPSTSDWIGAFGYDSKYDWIFLPIEVNGNSNLPVGDYVFVNNTETVKSGLAGGLVNSQENCGLFYYGFSVEKDGYHFRSDSARVMHIPTANSTIETNNYNAWINS